MCHHNIQSASWDRMQCPNSHTQTQLSPFQVTANPVFQLLKLKAGVVLLIRLLHYPVHQGLPLVSPCIWFCHQTHLKPNSFLYLCWAHGVWCLLSEVLSSPGPGGLSGAHPAHPCLSHLAPGHASNTSGNPHLRVFLCFKRNPRYFTILTITSSTGIPN